MDIKEDYVSFEIAKLLKEKGFDEPCSSTYDIAVSGGKPIFYEHDVLKFFPNGMKNSDDKYGMVISAPTLQMVMKWLRKVHNIHIWVEPNHDKEGLYNAHVKVGWWSNNWAGIGYNTYEKAVEAAIKYCLENLI